MSNIIDTTTDAYGDYVAVVVNGMRPKDRATERGITGATVGANVRRIRDAIANGAALPDGATDNDGAPIVAVPPFDAWVRTTHGDDAALAVSVVAGGVADTMRDRARALRAIDDATSRVTACDTRIAAIASMFDAATGDDVPAFDALRADYDAYVSSVRDADTPDA